MRVLLHEHINLSVNVCIFFLKLISSISSWHVLEAFLSAQLHLRRNNILFLHLDWSVNQILVSLTIGNGVHFL